MTKFFRMAIASLVVGGVLTLNACKKDAPEPEVNQEEFNRAVITFTRLDAAGNETAEKVTAEFNELEHDHGSTGADEHEHEHVHADLVEGAQYRLSIGLYVDEKLINQEITDEGEAHQFFFLPSEPGIVEYAYEDMDKNNKPIGLKGILDVKAHGEIGLNVILRHNLNKNHAAAAAWNSADYATAGGADDLNLSVDLHVGH